MTIEGVSVLKKKVADKKAEFSRIEGKIEQLKDRMITDFGCKTLEELSLKIETLKKEKSEKEETYQKSLLELEMLAKDLGLL